MPQWLTNLGSPDLHGPWLIVIAAVAALLILFFLYRFVFGHRLRVPAGGRTRQPRLGLVDAYSLDGQRQLVLVRRDNVEHLIMIGGPTDVLVESQIIRVSAPTTAAANREREIVAPVKAPPAAPPAPAPVAATAAAPPRAVSPPPVEVPQPRILKPAPTVQAESAPVLRRPEPAPKPREVAPAPKPREIAPAPQRPATPTRKDMSVIASAVVGVELAATTVVPIKPAAAPAPTPARAQQPQRPTLPPPIGTLAVSTRSGLPAPTREAPVSPPAKPQPAVMITPPLPPTARAPNAPDAFADLESLEAEMARLLGRDA